jgi:hypothetical protein
MYRTAPLLLLALLPACGPRAQAGPSLQLQNAASGSLDRRADQILKTASRSRRVAVWTSRPPIPVNELRVTYDTDQRSSTWRADISGGTLTLGELAGGELTRIGAWNGAELYRVRGGLLDGALGSQSGGRTVLMTAGYATHYQTDLAPLLRR